MPEVIRCTHAPNKERCPSCRQVLERVLDALDAGEDLMLVVDGSWVKPRHGGAGMVLGTSTGVVIATCAASITAKDSTAAELEAITLGLAWAPLETVWSDCHGAIEKALEEGLPASFLPQKQRAPFHGIAHHLASAARIRDWARCSRIYLGA